MIDSRIKKVLINNDQLESKIAELGSWVDKEFHNSNNLVLIGLMKGSIPFLAQLMKNVTIDHKIDFMTVSSYSGNMHSSGNLKIVTDLNHDIENKDILIVEDIIDSGLTLSNIVETLKMRNPSKIKVMTLLNKPQNRINNFKPDVFGFEIPDEFIVGFGLDVKGKMRNLPYIGIFDKTKIDEI